MPATAGESVPAGSPARGAAFFDLDRTLIRRSSMLALAPTLRRHGLIGWRSLARASIWHAVYLSAASARGALPASPTRPSGSCAAGPSRSCSALIAEEIEPLAALAFPDAITRMRAHQARGERAIVVSASLVDLVEPLADRLGLDAAIASRAEIRDGRYTGGSSRSCTAPRRPTRCGVRRRRTASTSAASSAYTDSRSDIQLLEAVGHPYAVNPDRALAGRRGARLAGPALRLEQALARRGGGGAAARPRRASRRGLAPCAGAWRRAAGLRRARRSGRALRRRSSRRRCRSARRGPDVAGLPEVVDAEAGDRHAADRREERERVGVAVEHGDDRRARSAGNSTSRIAVVAVEQPCRACRARKTRSAEVRQTTSTAMPGGGERVGGGEHLGHHGAHADERDVGRRRARRSR